MTVKQMGLIKLKQGPKLPNSQQDIRSLHPMQLQCGDVRLRTIFALSPLTAAAAPGDYKGSCGADLCSPQALTGRFKLNNRLI